MTSSPDILTWKSYEENSDLQREHSKRLPIQYRVNWFYEFDEGEQKIYLLGGNNNATTFEDVLSIKLELEGKFETWLEVASHIWSLNKEGKFDWDQVELGMVDDPNDEDLKYIKNRVDPLTLFLFIIDRERENPVTFVREDEPTFYYLNKVRKIL